MKKNHLLITICAMMFSLCACNSNESGSINSTDVENMSLHDMLVQAEDVNTNDLINASIKDIGSAKATYCNKILKLSGSVWSIAEDHLVLYNGFPFSGNYYLVDVYLPIEDKVSVSEGQHIVVVGNMTNKIIKYDLENSEYKSYHYQMQNANIYDKKEVYTATVISPTNEAEPGFYVKMGEADDTRLVYFDTSINNDWVSDGDVIKFCADCKQAGRGYIYKNAVLIE